ncbi:hypothetical protein C1H46_019345 [Malus baccata]|uniref:ADP-ribosyl cyclase/cyclic ADP-ribose hydrolase n=1 Tax=Malus baccata TaxID=106549 RepID=A0A540M8J5_MALBA|nr:hypothetical protein C1H46_019345 [Malus baccata]
MVGIQSRIKEVKSLLSNNDSLDVCTVGIWGMGGIGKTTLAKAVFKRLSSNFDASCLLNNVREKSEQKDGVDQLQKTLLKEILKEENLSIDSTSVRERLSRTKVLIVFDDVSDSRQIKDVAGDNLRYGDGSRIIVTSRERSVLMKAVRERKYIYQVEKLKTDDALRLFQFHAFNDNSPREEYTELSARAVKYAGGIPLALEVLGSLLFPCENKDEWEDVLSTLRDYPNEEIQNTFRVSYNRLGRNAQEVFLDIACFYKGKRIEDVKKMVDFGQLHGGSHAADGIRVLRDRSLISIDSEWETIDMHDLVQEMGRAIVRKQCIEEPGRRSRLFIDEDVYHILKNNTGTKKVQAIFFVIRQQNLDHADFTKMYNMRLLSVTDLRSFWEINTLSLSLPNSLRYLLWQGYPLKSLPPEFSLENLVELHMPYSKVTQLWNGGQNPVNLKAIRLIHCRHLTALPNLSGSPNIERINLHGCESLVEIPSYFKDLDKLTYLNLSWCKSLKYLPEMPDKLTYLDLSWCKSLKYLPEMPGNIEFLSLNNSGIKELPSSVWSHQKISSLKSKLKVSRAISKYGGFSLEKYWELPRGIDELNFSRRKMESLFCLTKLILKDCINVVSLPPSICKLKSLEEIDLSGCFALKVVPSNIYKLTNLKKLNFFRCLELQNFPQPAGPVGLLSLEVLELGCSGILEIPEYLICSTSLWVNLTQSQIRSIPALPVAHLYADGCESLKTVSSSRTAITQCWNRYELLQEQLTFYNCRSLRFDADARSCIMVDSQLRIMRVATASSKLKEEKKHYKLRIMQGATASSKLKEKKHYKKFSEPLVAIALPGYKIPKWFVHQNEGASINVRLPANWFREGFLGFALSFVASKFIVLRGLQFRCKYNFKTEEGESHEINCSFNCPCRDGDFPGCILCGRHVFVLYKDLEYEEGAKWSSSFYNRVTEVFVYFCGVYINWGLIRRLSCEVIRCGICLLYAEDAECLG